MSDRRQKYYSDAKTRKTSEKSVSDKKSRSSGSDDIIRKGYERDNKDAMKKRLKDPYALRDHALSLSASNARARQENPLQRKTRVEENMGANMEYLEPQVMSAVIKMDKKGYETYSSGFGAEKDIQHMDGNFTLDRKTIDTLKKMGVSVGPVPTNPEHTSIYFRTKSDTLQGIKEEWDAVVRVLPEKPVASTYNSRTFDYDSRSYQGSQWDTSGEGYAGYPGGPQVSMGDLAIGVGHMTMNQGTYEPRYVEPPRVQYAEPPRTWSDESLD